MPEIEKSPVAVFQGFTVSMSEPDSEYSEGTDKDIVIFIDTPSEFTGNVRIRVNDALIYNGNPDKEEDISFTQLDGFHIVTK